MAPPAASHRVTTDAAGAPILVKRATTAEGRRRLRGEAGVLRALAHPDLVRVVALVEDGEATELHLAWVGPHSLGTVTAVPAREAGRVVARVAEVVADLHGAGTTHGRLTPDHVLLGADARPVVTGLAEAVGSGRGDPGVDVAALGGLLTGLLRPLEGGPVIPDRRHRHRGDDGVRSALLTVADLAAADDPAARPTAAELAVQLRTIVTPARGRAPRRGRTPRRGRRGRATPTVPRATPAPPPRPPSAVVQPRVIRRREGVEPEQDPAAPPPGRRTADPSEEAASGVDRWEPPTRDAHAPATRPPADGRTGAEDAAEARPGLPSRSRHADRPDRRAVPSRPTDLTPAPDGGPIPAPQATPTRAPDARPGPSARGGATPGAPVRHARSGRDGAPTPPVRAPRPRPPATRPGPSAGVLGAAPASPRQPRRSGRLAHVPARRLVLVAALAGAVLASVVAATTLGGDAPTEVATLTPPTTTAPSAAPSTPPTTTGVGGRAVLPPPPEADAPDPAPTPPTEGCAPVAAGLAADVDGDGCPDALRIDRERVTVGDTTWVVGRPGDALAVADWDCDGTATVASLRPSTGEVFVFDRWVGAGDELTVRSATTVPGAEALRAVDDDGDGCAALTVTRPDGTTTAVPVGAA